MIIPIIIIIITTFLMFITINKEQYYIYRYMHIVFNLCKLFLFVAKNHIIVVDYVLGLGGLYFCSSVSHIPSSPR